MPKKARNLERDIWKRAWLVLPTPQRAVRATAVSYLESRLGKQDPKFENGTAQDQGENVS